MRTPVKVDGTALLGEANLGPLRLELPCLFWAPLPSPGTGAPAPGGSPGIEGGPSSDSERPLSHGGSHVLLRPSTPSELFTRNLSLTDGNSSWGLRLATPTGDTPGGPGSFEEAGEGALSVAWPLTEEARARLGAKGTSLVIWSNARALYRSKETFVRALVELREVMGPGPLLWAPRVGTPGNLALLHCMGIDALDSVEGLFLAASGLWLYPEFDLAPAKGVVGSAVRETGTCRCSPCRRKGEGISARAEHAHWQYEEEEARVRFMIHLGRLRELVEARTVGRPELGEMLRYFDDIGFSYQERHAPLASEGVLPYGVEASYHRPEMERYRRRFLERYLPPPTKRVLLVVPCSYTKPYSNSPTHRAIARAIGGAPDLGSVHTLSLTSPLGVVPRELENFYPARNYDIPVTGRWTEEERNWVLEGVGHVLSRGRYERIIFHLPEAEFEWLKARYPAGDQTAWTSRSVSPTSREGLSALEAEARSFPASSVPWDRSRLDEARSSFGFQFTPELANRVFEKTVRMRGPSWFVGLVGTDKQILATWKEDRGLWRFTKTGAALVLPAARDWWVEIDSGVTLHGDLFAPGALTGGSEVRIGGNVILVRDGVLAGVGEAMVPGSWIGRLERGMVVKSRSRAEDPIDLLPGNPGGNPLQGPS